MLSRTWLSSARAQNSALRLKSLESSYRALSTSRPCRQAESSAPAPSPEKPKAKEVTPLSSCPENTVLPGVNYLKGQQPVLAKKDSEYPEWLWSILKPKVYPEDGPGGKAEKVRLRVANRTRIKEQNFLKTQ